MLSFLKDFSFIAFLLLISNHIYVNVSKNQNCSPALEFVTVVVFGVAGSAQLLRWRIDLGRVTCARRRKPVSRRNKTDFIL